MENEVMNLAQLRTKYESMNDDELMEYLNDIRNRTRVKVTGEVKSVRKSTQSKLKTMLKGMSAEERKALLESLQG